MNMVLTRDRDALVLENLKLVHLVLTKKFHMSQRSPEYEEMVLEGQVALIKVAIQYKSSNGKFSTYAMKAIKNHLINHLNSARRHAPEASSIYEPNNNGRGGDDKEQITIEDAIECPNSNFPERIEKTEYCVRLINIILNCLNRTQRTVLLYAIGKLPQEEIAKRLNRERSSVGMYRQRAVRIAVKIEESNEDYTKIFSMEIVGNEYRFTFSRKDVKGFNKTFRKKLKKFGDAEKLSYYKISYIGNQIVIQLPADEETFRFIARLIEEIDDCNMLCTKKGEKQNK